MKQAPKKLLASLLAIALVLSCVIIPQTIISAQATDGEVDVTFSDAFLNTLNITSGDVISHNVYTGYEVGDTNARTGWTGDTGILKINSVTPAGEDTAVNGLQVYSANSNGYVQYPIQAKNFVLKLNMYTANAAGGNFNIEILNSSGAVATSLGVPANNRTNEGQITANTFSLKNYISGNTYPSAKGYTLSTANIDLSMEIICYNGYFYYVNLNGEFIACTPACAASSDTYQLQFRSWGAGVVITEMAVAELVSADDSFAASIGAAVSESVFYADYRGYNPTDKSDTTYKSDFASYSNVSICNPITPYNKDYTVTGLYVSSSYGTAYADINFTATDYVAKVSYVHVDHSGGYSSVILSDASDNFDAAIRFPYSNRNHDDNHHGLLAYKNEINVASSATKVSTYTVGTDVFNFCNTDAKETRNIEIDLYIYSYKGYVYYVKSDGTVIHKSVSYASGPATKLRLYSNYGGFAVTNVDIQALVPDNSVESTFADSINAVVGETAIYKDYTVYGATKGDWTAGSISTAAPAGSTAMETFKASGTAENSLYLNNSSGDANAYYTLPCDNFVAKVTFLEERDRDALVGVGVTDSANTALSLVKFPGSARKTEVNANQVHFTGKSWFTLDKTDYDLSVTGNPFTMYMVCFGDTVYWLDLNGNFLYKNTFTADSGRKLRIYASWTGIELLDVQVKKLSSVYSGGNGTEAAPYIIETAEQLTRAVGTFGGSKYYKLANDIYLNDVDAINWSTGAVIKDGYTPVEWFHNEGGKTGTYVGSDGTTKGTFEGTLDGDGYAIHGIWYPNNSHYGVVGLFPDTQNVTVKNLVLSHSFVRGYPKIGAITSKAIGGTFSNVVIDETVSVIHSGDWTASSCAGAFVGMSEHGSHLIFTNCATYAKVDNYAATLDFGLVGSTWNGTKITATNCICIGTLPFRGDSNGGSESTATVTSRFTVSNIYTDKEFTDALKCSDGDFYGLTTDGNYTLVATDNAKGQAALTSMAPLFTENVWYASTTNKYPQLLAWGEKHNDIDKSGVVDTGDLFALRTTILGTAAITYEWTDVNGDAVDADVADLVALKLKKKN